MHSNKRREVLAELVEAVDVFVVVVIDADLCFALLSWLCVREILPLALAALGERVCRAMRELALPSLGDLVSVAG